jgi:hypothetical protein
MRLNDMMKTYKHQKAKRMLWGRQMFTTSSGNLEQFAEQNVPLTIYFVGKN